MSIEPIGVIPEWTMGDRLRKAREVTGLSQAQFGKALDVSPKTVGNYETGRVETRRIVMKAWALRTGVPLQWLETGEVPSSGDDGTSTECTPRDSNPEPIDLRSWVDLRAAA